MSATTNSVTEDKKTEKEEGTKSMLAYVSLKNFVTDHNQGYAGYYVMQSQIINILLVGRSQAGKSTLLATLLNPQQAVQGRGYTVTKEPQIQAFILNDEHTNTQYTINVIDTPGLREKRIDDLQSRSDDALVTLAQNFISKQVTYLNIVIYVTVAKRTNELDAEAFKCIREYLGKEFESNSLLVLSHCEEVPKTRFEQIVNDMKTFPETNEILNYCKLGVLPYGTMNADYLAIGDDDDDDESPEVREKNIQKNTERVRDTLRRTEKMRQDLFLAIIKSANRPRSISQLEGLMKTVKEKEKKTLDATLNAAKEIWNKEKHDEIKKIKEQHAKEQEEKTRHAAELSQQIELQNKNFLEEMKAKDEEEKRYKTELSKQIELQYKKLLEEMREEENKQYKTALFNESELLRKISNEEMVKNIKKQETEFENKWQTELRKQRNEFDQQLADLSEEKARLFAAKQVKEKERQMTSELEKLRQEIEHLHADLYAEKQAKEAGVEELKKTRELFEEKAQLHAEQQVKLMREQVEKSARSYNEKKLKEMKENESHMARKNDQEIASLRAELDLTKEELKQTRTELRQTKEAREQDQQNLEWLQLFKCLSADEQEKAKEFLKFAADKARRPPNQQHRKKNEENGHPSCCCM